MSGIFTHRVNRTWDRSQTNITAAVFFWDWINYIDDHAGMTWIAYGTGKTQTGTTPPSSWLNWDTVNDPVPWGDNSWVVFEASNADPLLDGGGGMPWQMKLQVTLATAFDDCNVADTDYDFEGRAHSVAGRVCPVGGWDSTPLDFNPVSGEEISTNFLMYGYPPSTSTFYTSNENYYLDIIGDDDTIFWTGAAFETPANSADRSRGGYVGMIQRRSSAVTYPFYFTTGALFDINAGQNTNIKSTSTLSQWEHGPNGADWPDYSLWLDKTKVSEHAYDTWERSLHAKLQTHVESGDSILYSILLCQWENPLKYAILGDLRLIHSCGNDWAWHEIRGTDPQYRNFIYGNTAGGIAERWPVGVAPIW